jgi:hypothetical protein
MQNERGFGWFMSDSLKSLMEEIDFLVAERKELSARGPTFRIVHRFRMPGTDCMPGEEIVAVFLVYRGREHHLRLSLAMRILFDYLARHSRLPQSARQVELGIRADEFYKRHAANATGRAALTRRIPRSAVKVYIKRLHRALSLAFQSAKMHIDPCNVLITQKTVGNEVGYQLDASCDWIHIDLASGDCQPLWGGNGGHRESVTDFAAEGLQIVRRARPAGRRPLIS